MSPSDFSDLPFPVFHLVIPASSRIFRELKSPGFLIPEDRDILGLSTHEVYPSARLPGRTVVSYSAFSPLSRLLVVEVKKLQQPATGTVIFCGTLCRQRMVNAVSFPLGSMALCVVPTFLHVLPWRQNELLYGKVTNNPGILGTFATAAPSGSFPEGFSAKPLS